MTVLAGGTTLPAPPASAQTAQRIAAVVGDDIISVHDLATRIALLMATSNLPNTPENRRRLAPHVMHVLIDEKLKLQEANRLGVRVSRKEVLQAVARIAAQMRLSPDDLQRYLAGRGVSIAPLLEQAEAEVAWVKAVRARSEGQIRISEEEIDARIQRIQANAGKPELRVAEIYLPVDDPSKEQEVRQLGERLMQELREGASFPALARNFSQGASAAMGGELGWLRPDQMAPELQQEIRDLGPGEVVGPVRTVDGYHIVLVIQKRIAPGLKQGGSVLVSLQQLVLPLPANATPSQVSERMRRAAEIAAKAGSCAELEAAGKKEGSPLSGYLGTVELSQLDEPLQRLVRPLRAGEVSAPLRTDDGIVVVMVCERQEQDTDPEVREQIRQLILGERLAAAARRQIRNLRRETFVDIRI